MDGACKSSDVFSDGFVDEFDSSAASVALTPAEVRSFENPRVLEYSGAAFSSSIPNEKVVITHSLDGVITGWNSSAEQLFGYSSQAIVGQPTLTLYPHPRRDEALVLLNRVRRGEPVDHYFTVRVHSDGCFIPVMVALSPVNNRNGEICGVSECVCDLRDRIKAKGFVWDSRHFDEFTGLLNQEGFRSFVNQALAKGVSEEHQLGLILLKVRNLDFFREVFGVGFVERLMMLVAVSLKLSLGGNGVVARFGSQEFAVCARNVSSAEEVSAMAYRIVHDLSSVITLDSTQISLRAITGCVFVDAGNTDCDALLRNARRAMFRGVIEL